MFWNNCSKWAGRGDKNSTLSEKNANSDSEFKSCIGSNDVNKEGNISISSNGNFGTIGDIGAGDGDDNGDNSSIGNNNVDLLFNSC